MEDDDETEAPTASQGVSEAEIQGLVSDVVRCLLFKSYQQPGVPIRREELTHIVSRHYKQRNLPGRIVNLARKRLRDVFGIELVELEKYRQARGGRSGGASQAAADSSKEYVLKSALPLELRKEYVEVSETAALRGLTLAVIGIVLLAGDKCPEEAFWCHLEKLGISESNEAHPVFGNIKLTLEAIMRQRYVVKEKAGDGEGFVYALADRSLDKAMRTQVEQFISKLVEGGATAVTPADECEE